MPDIPVRATHFLSSGGLFAALLILAAGCSRPIVIERPVDYPGTPALRPASPLPPAAAPSQRTSPPQPDRPPLEPPRDRPGLVVALGDSITYGCGDAGTADCRNIDPNRDGYTSRLAAMEHVPVINEGVCGNTSLDGRKRIIPVLDRLRPEVLLILLGTNDSPSDIVVAVENLRFMVRAALSRGTRPVIGTLTPAVGNRERFIVSLNEQIRRLAAAERIAIADHYRAFVGNPQFQVHPEALLAPDGLHPNSSGYNLMAVVWSRAIRGARGGPQGAPGPSGR